MNNQLLVQENTTSNDLKKSIAKRKKALMRITDRYEHLKMQIDAVSEEYMVRVGRLYSKDNVLDIEIIRHKKIKELMDVGISYEDAVKELKNRYKQEEQEEEEFFTFEEGFFAEEGLQSETDSSEAIRKLWKKLLHKFHPDLTTDFDEKEKRTEMMKTINTAYKKGDLSALQEIEEKESIADIDQHELSIIELEQALVTIENAIIRTRNQHKDLKESEWYAWTKMTKSSKDKLLNQMEFHIKETIVAKEKELVDLKRMIGKKD